MLKFKINDIMRAAFGLAMIDGGFVIAVQIINFLCTYFFGRTLTNTADVGTLSMTSVAALLVSVFSLLNETVIIYRIAGLARGIKYSPVICYQQALRRWPMLLLLSLIFGSVLLLLLSVVSIALHIDIRNYARLLSLGITFLIPFGMLACTYVIDQDKGPIAAIKAMLNTVKKIGISLLLNISLLYAVPFAINSLLLSNAMTTKLTSYGELFNSIWYLYCHALVIVVYAGTNVANDQRPKAQKTSKVIVV
ncbi:MAG TPA: hypothetical protein VLG38_06550 [Gammaproteobacteria bacterium]|nr:hypothetical protein [Gammaproteobacteria bacterium]